MQHATAEVAGITIVRGGLRSTGTGQTTIPVESDKGFCVHSIVPYRQTTHRHQPSLQGRQRHAVKWFKGVKKGVCVWLSHHGVLA